MRGRIFLGIFLWIFLSGFVSAANSFNLEVEIPSQYTTAFEGEKIHFTVKVINLANLERMDITLEYKILQGEDEINFKRETVAVETQASFVGEILIPEKTKGGDSVLQVRIIGAEEEVFSEGQGMFVISERASVVKFLLKYKWPILLIFGIMAILIAIITNRKRFGDFFQKKKIKSRVSEIIKNRVQTGKVTKDKLEHSVLPRRGSKNVGEDELIY